MSYEISNLLLNVEERKDRYAIKSFIKREQDKKGKTPTLEQIDDFFTIRINRKQNQEISKILNNIREKDCENNYFQICKKLEIDYNTIMRLGKKYNKRKLIIYTWFYYDKINKTNEKVLSQKKLKQITEESVVSKNANLLDYIVSYKIGNINSINKLFETEESYFRTIIKNYLKKYSIPLTKNLMADLLSECFIFLHDKLNDIILRDIPKIKSYLKKSLHNPISKFIKSNYLNYIEISIDDFGSISDNHLIYFRQSPLQFLIKVQELHCAKQAYHRLKEKDQKIIYEMYCKSNNSNSIQSILDGVINGYDIHDAIGKFQDQFFKLYET